MKCVERVGRCAVALAAGLLAALPAWSKGGTDAAALRQFGGRYAVDCENPAAPALRVGPDALLVEQNGQRMVGRKPVSARRGTGHAGNGAPPKNFQVALKGEVRGGAKLLFMVYTDSAGPYILLDGDAKVTAALGRALLAPKYRRCDPRSAPVASASAVAPGSAPAMKALIADPAFKRAYLRAIGGRASQRWLARLDGPAAPTRMQAFGGTPHVVIAVCKAHDCYDHSAVFVYSAPRERVFGLIQQNGRQALVGAPGPALAAQLGRLWQTEWRQ